MANEADDSSSKLVEQAAPSAQFPPLQRNLDQLEALSEKLKSKTLRTEAPSQSIAATRLLAREGLNAEQLARDLKSFELKAALGGAVGKIQRIHAFLRIRLRDYGVLDFDAGDARRQPPVDTTWQQIYFCLRTGYYDEAKNVASSSRVSHQFAFQLNEWITTGGMVSAETAAAAAEECEKMLRMGDRVGRIAYDKKKLLLYAILSGSRRQIDRLLRELPTLFNTIEDFLWFKLCAVRDQPGGSSFVLNDGSSPYTLSDLQAYLNKFEPLYYTKNGKDPLVYPYVLLLSIQLLPAILYMCKDTGNEAYNVDVVHISIALGDHGILAEGFGAGQTSGVMDACAEASSLIRQYGALYLQHDDLSMALEYYAQAAGTMGGGQLSWTGRGNVHQQWQRTSMLKQLLLELLLRDGGIYLLLGSRGAGEEGELGRFLTDENSRQQFLLEAARQCQEAGLYEKSIEIQKRVGAFSAALDTINKCLSEAIGALSRGRMDGESRTAGLIHSGNELVESFKYYPEVRKDTCKACWKDEMGMAEIVSRKGRLLTTIGIVRDGKIYCSIEETLYMAEVGALHLLHDDICLSLGEIYKMLSQGRYGCCWESFVVYKHLKSLGYIVSRHGVPWTLSHLTKNDSIFNEATTKTNLKSDSEYEDTVITIKLFKSMHIDKVKPVFDVYAHNSKFRKSSPGNPNFVLCLTSSLPPSKQEISDLERRCSGIPLKLCNVEHGRVTFFSFNTVELPILP